MFVCEKHYVVSDVGDWPEGLPQDEREILPELVRDVLRWAKGRPLTLHEVTERVQGHPRIGQCRTFRRAAQWDWLYACVERSLRAADGRERWVLPD